MGDRPSFEGERTFVDGVGRVQEQECTHDESSATSERRHDGRTTIESINVER
jgi:hypothetical protein